MAQDTDIAGEPVCGAVAERCICNEAPNHDGPHLCKCSGSWRGNIDGDDFEIVALPDLSWSDPAPGGARERFIESRAQGRDTAESLVRALIPGIPS